MQDNLNANAGMQQGKPVDPKSSYNILLIAILQGLIFILWQFRGFSKLSPAEQRRKQKGWLYAAIILTPLALSIALKPYLKSTLGETLFMLFAIAIGIGFVCMNHWLLSLPGFQMMQDNKTVASPALARIRAHMVSTLLGVVLFCMLVDAHITLMIGATAVIFFIAFIAEKRLKSKGLHVNTVAEQGMSPLSESGWAGFTG